MNCPRCNSEKIRRSFYSGIATPGCCRKCESCEFTFNTEGDKRNIVIWEAQKEVRPDKIEEIKAVWNSLKFKTNNQRLVHLFRHCKKVEYGYTIREFVYAIWPEKDGPLPQESSHSSQSSQKKIRCSKCGEWIEPFYTRIHRCD